MRRRGRLIKQANEAAEAIQYQEREMPKRAQRKPKHYCYMINDPYDHNVTPKSSRINQPTHMSRTRAILENPVNNSVISKLPMQCQLSAWKQTIESAPTSAEMNRIQYQYEFEPDSLESSSTNTDVCYIPPTTRQDTTLLRASLDTRMTDPKERGKQRNRWKTRLNRQHVKTPKGWPRADDKDMDRLMDAISLNPRSQGKPENAERTRKLIQKYTQDSQESKPKPKKQPRYQSKEISTESTLRLKLTRIHSEQEQPKEESSNPLVPMIKSNPAGELPDFTEKQAKISTTGWTNLKELSTSEDMDATMISTNEIKPKLTFYKLN